MEETAFHTTGWQASLAMICINTVLDFFTWQQCHTHQHSVIYAVRVNRLPPLLISIISHTDKRKLALYSELGYPLAVARVLPAASTFILEVRDGTPYDAF